jgi:hypothetical protein
MTAGKHECLERYKECDPADDRLYIDGVAGRIDRGDEDAEGREDEIGASLVDQDAEAEIFSAIESLNHREPLVFSDLSRPSQIVERARALIADDFLP